MLFIQGHSLLKESKAAMALVAGICEKLPISLGNIACYLELEGLTFTGQSIFWLTPCEK